MKPKVYIDQSEERIKVESDSNNKITITEAHSFIKDLISVIYDYHKLYPWEKVENYIEERKNGVV
jgi:hypothetical protein